MGLHDQRRAGMTLVELLVVVTIFGLLAVAVLPNIANTADDRRTRESVRMITSYVAKAQSRAIGRQEWAGFTMVPPNATSTFAIDLFLADVPIAYRGDTLTAGVTVTPSTATEQTLSFTGAFVAGVPNVAAGDLIRFDSRGPWYELTANAAAFRLRTDATIDALAGQNQYNTPWPAPSPATHTFEILRQPTRSGSPLSLGDGRCIDLYWSGYGPAATYATFGASGGYAAGTSATVLFDGSGRVRQLSLGTSRFAPSGPVMLLVGQSIRAGQAFAALNPSDDSVGANWQYPDSFWIAIDPASGIAKAAECAAGAADVVGSQAFIRSELSTGGR
jgi:prepilin-type N-terminal cleavage/methylation domain-containing protein